jgi:hypothetical protein
MEPFLSERIRPAIGVKLYKYRSLATQEQQDRAADILINNRVFFANRHTFNDPFDCHIPISWNVTREELIRKLKSVYKEDGSPIPAESVEQYVAARIADGTVNELITTSVGHKAVDAVLNKFGVLCLSEKPNDILMWAHYADCHRGICVEFEVTKETFFWDALPVIYSEAYPHLKATMSTQDLADGLFRTKSNHWEYEKEWRIIGPCAGLEEFSARSLTGVILGCQILPEVEKSVSEWLSRRGLPTKVYRANKAEDRFAVNIAYVGTVSPPVL